MSHINTQTQKMRSIPAAKRKRKDWKSLGGILVVLVGFLTPRLFPEFPMWFAMLVIAAGAWTISEERVKGFLGYVPAGLRDIRDAIMGKNGR